MKRFIVPIVTVLFLTHSIAFIAVAQIAVAQGATQYAQATTNTQTTTRTPSEPASVSTTVKGGTIAADVLEWLKVVFIPLLGAVGVAVAYRVMSFFGVKIEEGNRANLQSIIVNGLNQAAVKAQAALRSNQMLDVDVKSQVIADAVAYTQTHAKETIRALGLDPDDPKAVDAIRARIQTAIVDPLTPTHPELVKVIDSPAPAPRTGL